MPLVEELVARFAHLAGTPAVIGVCTTAAILVILDNCRVLIAALAVQYIFGGLLYTQVLAPQVAGIKMLVGLLACLIFFVTSQQIAWQRSRLTGSALSEMPSTVDRARDGVVAASGFGLPWRLGSRVPFRIFAVIMVGLLGLQLVIRAELSLPGFSETVSLAAFQLVCLGLLLLGLSEEPLKAGFGLLTVLTGFGLLYSGMESALAVIGLLAAVEFSVALGTSYLAIIRAHSAAEEETQVP